MIDDAAVIYFDVDLVFQNKAQADHVAQKLVEDGRFEFTWSKELTESSEQWRISCNGPWAENLEWIAKEAKSVDVDL